MYNDLTQFVINTYNVYKIAAITRQVSICRPIIIAFRIQMDGRITFKWPSEWVSEWVMERMDFCVCVCHTFRSIGTDGKIAGAAAIADQ